MNIFNPLISIIVPCFNQGGYLLDTLQSVFNQTYTNWECIIINDGSTDDTEEIALEWIKKDIRFLYIKKENGGLSSARNYGIKAARGGFILFLDSDDFISNKKLQIAYELFKSDLYLDVVINDFKMFDTISNKYYDSEFKLCKSSFNFSSILLNWDHSFNIPIHCAIFRKASLGSILFIENLKAKEDWVFWCFYFYNNPNVFFVDSYESYYRKNTFGITSNRKLMFENKLLAYNLLLNWLPNSLIKKFSLRVFESIISDFNELYFINSSIRNSKRYKIGDFIVNSLKKISPF
jgi:glycosyltransferase involved in cell wall biosynthesis